MPHTRDYRGVIPRARSLAPPDKESFMTPSILNKDAISALLLSACGAASETPAPKAGSTTAATAAPAAKATDAPQKAEAQPTKAPAPAATKAPVKPAESAKTSEGKPAAAGSLVDRMTAAGKAKSYEATMIMRVSGDVIELPVPGSSDTPLIEMTQIKYEDDSETVMRGLFAAMFGSESSVTMRTVGGKTYVRGPAPLLGAPDDGWYVLENEQVGASN